MSTRRAPSAGLIGMYVLRRAIGKSFQIELEPHGSSILLLEGI